jgi:uncharacterized protein YbjT (DUF2867 family)
MEWHAYRLLGKDILEKGKAFIIGAGNNPTNFIATEDLVAALDAIALNPAYINKRIDLGGPDNVTRNKVADLFIKACGREAKISHMPLGMAKALGWLLQPLHPGIARIMHLAVASEHTDETMPAGSTIAQFGLQPTTMAMFVQQKIAAIKTSM